MYKAQYRKINAEVKINCLIFSTQLTPKNVILHNYVTERYVIQCMYGRGLHSPHPWKCKFIAEWRELYPSCGTGTTHRKVTKVTGTRDTAWPVAWGWTGTEALGKFSWMGQQLLIITNRIVISAWEGIMKTSGKRKWYKILVQVHTRRTLVPSCSWNHFSMITNTKHMHCEEGDGNITISF